MAFPNSLPADQWAGSVGEVEIEWTLAAKNWLPATAVQYKITSTEMKAATEHLSMQLAKELRQRRILIRGAFHNTTTIQAAKVYDGCHITVALSGVSVHIYVNLVVGLPIQDVQIIRRTHITNGMVVPF
ncbi:hypothetical protein N7466_010617 [Penicillium verhagenii]|uniref:uncharacterized protein n=1 Tax=Penicillium verhagenii TaxID=1562060 RepID=UPI0025450918|nr:uncharacterized protein N7466_010617 [Penicillium verhagenii]KAJ5918625.1 hypothetical protein N7466_010617 [Penicillium verhagenii]